MSIMREKPIETVTIFKEPVTPNRAKELLQHKNPDNRKLSTSAVKKYVHDIRLGAWDDTAINPIVFDKNDILRNGEHRLTAIAASGKTVNLWFAYDTQPSNTFDNGTNRTVLAQLKMHGINSSKSEVALIRTIGRFCFGVVKVSEGEFQKALLADGEGLSKICAAASKGVHNAPCRNAVVSSALYCAYKCGVPITTIEKFAKVVNTGIVEELGNNSPIILRGQIAAGIHHESDRILVFKATQEALSDYINKIDRRRVYTGKNAYFSTKFVDGFRNGTIY